MTPTKRPTASEIVELLANTPRLISPCIDVPLASVQVERTDSLELIPSVRKPSGSISQTNRPMHLHSKRKQAASLLQDHPGPAPLTVVAPNNNGQVRRDDSCLDFMASHENSYSPMVAYPASAGAAGQGAYNSPFIFPSEATGSSGDPANEPLLVSNGKAGNYQKQQNSHPYHRYKMSLANGHHQQQHPHHAEASAGDYRRRTGSGVDSGTKAAALPVATLHSSAYVPPGYIMLDHTDGKGGDLVVVSRTADQTAMDGGSYLPTGAASV